jgi:hypothetical protein
LAKSQDHHANTKHIDVRYHFVRDVIGHGNISLMKVMLRRLVNEGSVR